jgi:hypothetical protein
MAKINIIDEGIVIQEKHVFIYGYYKVNGSRSEFFHLEKEMPERELDAYREQLKAEHFTVGELKDDKGTHDINFVIHKRA